MLTAFTILAVAILWSTARDIAYDDAQQRQDIEKNAWLPQMLTLLRACALGLPRDFGSAARKFQETLTLLVFILPSTSQREQLARLIEVIPPRPFLLKGRAGAIAMLHVYSHALGDRRTLLEPEAELLKTAPDVATTVLAQLRLELDAKGLPAAVSEAQRKLEKKNGNPV